MRRDVRLNGETRSVEAATLFELLRELDLDPAARGLAIVMNGAVARRAAWPDTPVRSGDEVEIVRPVAGG